MKSQSSLQLINFAIAVFIIVLIGVALYSLGIFSPSEISQTRTSEFSLQTQKIGLLAFNLGTDGIFTLLLHSRSNYEIMVESITIGGESFSFQRTIPPMEEVGFSGILSNPGKYGERYEFNLTIKFIEKLPTGGWSFPQLAVGKLSGVYLKANILNVLMNGTKIAPSIHNKTFSLPYKIVYQALGENPGLPEWESLRYMRTSLTPETSPQLVLGKDGYIYCVFQHWTNESVSPTSTYGGNYWDVYLVRSLDAKTWSNATVITNNTVADVQPSIIQGSNGTLVIVFQEYDGHDYELFLSVSNDGTNWTTYQITNNSYSCGDATIEQDSNGMYYITYEATVPPDSDGEIYLINSTNLVNWSSPIQLTNNSFPDFDPDILIHNDTFYLTWAPRVTSTQEIYYSKARNPFNVSEWNLNKMRLTNNSVHDFEPSIFIDKYNEIFISFIRWFNVSEGPWNRTTAEIFILNSTLSNDNVWSETQLTNNSVRDTYPGLIQDVDGLNHVIYAHQEDNLLQLAIQDRILDPIDASRVVIYDPLPQGTALIPGSVSHGGTLNGRTLIWNLTSVYGGTDGSVSFNVLIDQSVSNGTYITNEAEILYYDYMGRLGNKFNVSVTTLVIE